MTALFKLIEEINALSEEEKCSRGISRTQLRSLGFTGVLEDRYRILGQVSAETRAVEVLAWRRFETASVVLRDYPNSTLEEGAIRNRVHGTLESERKALLNLFKMLVESEVPEAANYSSWEVSRDGQVIVLKQAISNDQKWVDFFSGKTQAA